MKNLLVFISAVLVCAVSSSTLPRTVYRTITGSGNAVTETRPLGVATALDSRSPLAIQLKKGSRDQITLTVDDQYLQYVQTTVSGNTLTIKIQDNINFQCPNGRDCKLQAVLETSSILNSIDSSGSGDIDANYEFAIPSLQITSSGSGSIRLPSISTDTLSVRMTGSGNVVVSSGTASSGGRVITSGAGDFVAPAVSVGNMLVCSSSGTGNIQVGARGARLEVQSRGNGDVTVMGDGSTVTATAGGTGDLHLASFQAQDVEAVVTGTGDIEVAASRTLKATISGTGDIIYRGNPTVTKTITGVGEVRKEN